jgi:hypothetical protein
MSTRLFDDKGGVKLVVDKMPQAEVSSTSPTASLSLRLRPVLDIDRDYKQKA